MAEKPEPLFESPLIQTLMSIGDDYYAAKAVADRIERLETVVRTFGLHEPDCPLFIEIRDEVGHSGKYSPTKKCTCWLTRPPEET